MMQLAKVEETRKNSHGRTYKEPKYKIMMRVQNLNGYIKAAVFLQSDMLKGQKTPCYEIFINEKGKEWISRRLDKNGVEDGWTESMFWNLCGIPYYNYTTTDQRVYISRDGMDTLKRLPLENDKQEKGVRRLQAWQQEQRKAEIKRQEQREQKPWDEDMALVPKLAGGFKEWMRRDVCRDTYIIYEYGKGNVKEGYCSRCKRMVPVTEPRHRKKTQCPKCKADAMFMASGKIKTLVTNTYEAEMMQKIKGGLVVRRFRQWQRYYGADYRNPNVITAEDTRILIFEDGRTVKYDWTSYKNKITRWCRDKGYYPAKRTYYWSQRIKFYKRNFKQIKENSVILKQSAIDRWETLPATVTDYLAIERGNPAVEMLAKIGMFRLAKNLIDESYDRNLLDQEQTELSKMLKIDNARMKRLKDMDGNINSLKWMQYEKLHNTIWPDEMIKDLGNAEVSTAEFNFLPHPVNVLKCYRYVKKQSVLIDETIWQTVVTWRDYINMAEQMKMNTKVEQIAKPKNVKEAHDRLVMLKKEKGIEKEAAALEKKWKKVDAHLEKIQKFEYEYGDYCIVAPKKIIDIVKEGMILGHCVHTCDYYFSRIQTDETYLFFLRKKASPDMPWYTLEVEPSGNIRQKRTTGDKQNADFDKALPFLKKWQKHFKSLLTEEEKKLGAKADKLRQQEYKKLREDGNRVWHGPLAGKLLADVLEADFMEAI